MRYSKKTNGFYPEDIEYRNLPDDVIVIPDELYQQLKGKSIEAGEDGVPRILTPPPPTPEQIIAMAEMKRTSHVANANTEIAWRQDAVDADMATSEESRALTEWKKYRVLLMRIDTSKPVWPPKPE